MLNPDDFKRAVQTIEVLGTTPAVLVKVAKLARDPNTDLAAVCSLLRNDGPLVADIIRISNSPYYAPASSHGNLSSAVGQIGLREVVRVVNLSLARQLFARDLTSYGVPASEYWGASVAYALVMESLAAQTGLNPEDAFTVGILHAIGLILIDHVIQEKGLFERWDGQELVQEWERRAVGFDYAEAGAMLLEHWLFPSSTCDVIRDQLDSNKVVEQVSLLGLLQFAQRLIALTGLDFENEDWRLPQKNAFVNASGLTQAAASLLVATCRNDFQSLRKTVDLESATSPRPMERHVAYLNENQLAANGHSVKR
jgi:HD-like signal output (HDOD) protein